MTINAAVSRPCLFRGALVIDSIPPATTILDTPASISVAAIIAALRLEPQTLLIVVQGVVTGIPTRMATCLAGAWPAPGLQDLTHVELVDHSASRVNPCSLEELLYRHGTQFSATVSGQRTSVLTNGSTSICTNHRLGHAPTKGQRTFNGPIKKAESSHESEE